MAKKEQGIDKQQISLLGRVDLAVWYAEAGRGQCSFLPVLKAKRHPSITLL